MPVTVAALAVAPVKGMRMMAADELAIEPGGAVGDRAFVVLESDHRLVSTERTPELLQVAPTWDPVSGVLDLAFPGGDSVAGRAAAAGERITTALYDGRLLAGRVVARGPLCAALSEHLGRAVRLMVVEPGQTGADDFPVTLMSNASLAAVGEAVGDGDLDARRFRMNIRVEGLDAWAEHGWSGREVALGNQVRVRVVDPVPRCVVTTHNPQDGARDALVLHGLARLRGKRDVTFGVWCEVRSPGVIRRGDPVRALDG